MPGGWGEAGQHLGCLGALERQQRPVFEHLELATPRQTSPDMGKIALLAGGVDDQDQMAATRGHHEVVKDAALVVGEQRVAHLADRQLADVGRDQGLEGGRRVVATQDRLAHVGNVEQTSRGASMAMLGEDALVLERHLVAGKRHHLGAQLAMEGVQGRLLELRIVGLGHAALQQWLRQDQPRAR